MQHHREEVSNSSSFQNFSKYIFGYPKKKKKKDAVPSLNGSGDAGVCTAMAGDAERVNPRYL